MEDQDVATHSNSSLMEFRILGDVADADLTERDKPTSEEEDKLDGG